MSNKGKTTGAKKARLTVSMPASQRDNGAAVVEEDEEQLPVAGPSSRRIGIAQKQANEEDAEEADDDNDFDSEDDEDDDMSSGVSEDEESLDGGADEPDDYDDILKANEQAGQKKKKRKRALPQDAFGSMLSELIAAPIPTKQLRPMHPPPSAEALEKRARKVLQAQRHEREERGHVKDIIAGWTPRPNVPFSQWNKIDDATVEENANLEYAIGGAEKEKELRRLAQRGVVRLFNAIKAAQYTEEAVTKGNSVPSIAPAGRLAIKDKDASPAPSANGSGAAAAPVSRAANVLGSRGKQEALANLSKASFLDLFQRGSAARPKTGV